MLLAIDSATQRISLALHDGDEVLAEHSWRSVNRHSAELPPAVARMLAQQEGTLSALAVACGPGSFSGLRIGVAFAKGLAAARALPLVGITTQDILAAAQPPCPGHALLILLAAGRSRSHRSALPLVRGALARGGRGEAADSGRAGTVTVDTYGHRRRARRSRPGNAAAGAAERRLAAACASGPLAAARRLPCAARAGAPAQR